MDIHLSIDDRLLAPFRFLAKRRVLTLGLALCLAASAAYVYAVDDTAPNQFVEGTVISSAAVNDNFNTLYAAVSTIEARMAAVATLEDEVAAIDDTWSGRFTVSEETYRGDDFAGAVLCGDPICPDGYHVCSALEWSVFNLLSREAVTEYGFWLTGNYPVSTVGWFAGTPTGTSCPADAPPTDTEVCPDRGICRGGECYACDDLDGSHWLRSHPTAGGGPDRVGGGCDPGTYLVGSAGGPDGAAGGGSREPGWPRHYGSTICITGTSRNYPAGCCLN